MSDVLFFLVGLVVTFVVTRPLVVAALNAVGPRVRVWWVRRRVRRRWQRTGPGAQLTTYIQLLESDAQLRKRFRRALGLPYPGAKEQRSV